MTYFDLTLKLTQVKSTNQAISYSQGLADFQFLNAYCHQNLIDYEGDSFVSSFHTMNRFGWQYDLVNKTDGKLLIRDDDEVFTDMSYIKLFPYVFFGCIVVGAMGNMLWFSWGVNFSNFKLIFNAALAPFSSAQKISAQTGYVMDGMQEAVGELIVAVKASSNRLLKLIETSQREAANCNSRKGIKT